VETVEPILDFHTHAQNVFGMCCVSPALRPFLRRGFTWLYEKSGFDPRMVRIQTTATTGLVVREMHARFASFGIVDYLAAMKQNGVTHACALPVEPMATTTDLLAIARARPEIIPFASVDFESGEDPPTQLRRHLSAGCKGLKLHPIMQNVAPQDERVIALFEELRGTEVPVLFHTGRMHYFLGARSETPEWADPELLAPLAKQFPEQPIVLGHMGLVRSAKAAIAVAAEHRNVFLEVSFQPASVLREALGRVGPARLLLGSDWPASEARSEITQIKKALGGDRAAERAILFDNGATLLRRAGVGTI
jgi:predicted TIM-barrel fold metal-dependent hydrolase